MAVFTGHGDETCTPSPLMKYIHLLPSWLLISHANNMFYQEEMRRLDIFHKFFLLARGNCAFSYPTPDSIPTSILDLGTGTGIWAIYVAEK